MEVGAQPFIFMYPMGEMRHPQFHRLGRSYLRVIFSLCGGEGEAGTDKLFWLWQTQAFFRLHIYDVSM